MVRHRVATPWTLLGLARSNRAVSAVLRKDGRIGYGTCPESTSTFTGVVSSSLTPSSGDDE